MKTKYYYHVLCNFKNSNEVSERINGIIKVNILMWLHNKNRKSWPDNMKNWNSSIQRAHNKNLNN